MAKKKNICKHCAAKAECACEVCAKKDKDDKKINNVCHAHSIYIDIAMRLEQHSRLGMSKHKEHPQFFLCLSEKGKGCAVKVVKAMLEALGKKVKTKKVVK